MTTTSTTSNKAGYIAWGVGLAILIAAPFIGL